MVAMLLVKADLKPASYFSIKRAEAYQFFPSYVLPPPSTLLGAFARGLFLLRGMPAPDNEEVAKRMIVTATVRAISPLAKTGTLVKRLRTLEPREGEERKEGFKPRTDAMVREIVSSPHLEIYYVINEREASKNLGEHFNNEVKRIIYSIERLGDSESLVTVLSVQTMMVNVREPDPEVVVNTILVEDLVEKEKVSGDYIYTIMPDMKDRRKPKGYFIPLVHNKDRTDVYNPSEFRVKPKTHTLMVKFNTTSILLLK